MKGPTMKKLIFFVYTAIPVFLYSCASLQSPKESSINPNDIVRWNDSTKLSWDDFQGQPIKEAQVASEIFIQTPASMHKATFLLPASTTVDCYVDKKASWVKKSQAKPPLLQYNQTLFDLHELYARKLRKKLTETNFGFTNPAGVFDSLYQAHNFELTKAVSQYRTECGMGSKNKKVKEWSDKIAADLKELDEFKTK